MHKDNQEQSWICFICVTSNHQLTSGLFRSLLVWTPLKSTIWNVIEDNVLYSAKSRSVSSKNHLSLDGFNPAHLDPDPQRPPGQLAAAHVWLVNPDLCMALVWLPAEGHGTLHGETRSGNWRSFRLMHTAACEELQNNPYCILYLDLHAETVKIDRKRC